MIFYFGQWGIQRGHYLYTPEGRSARQLVPPELDERRLDSKALCPSGPYAALPGRPVEERDQVQGREHLYHLETSQGPWTVLALWDRTADSRFGSLSSFVLQGHHEAAYVWEAATRAFPVLVARIKGTQEV